MEQVNSKDFKITSLYSSLIKLKTTPQKVALFGVILFIYCMLFYYMRALQLRLDFYSFYASALAYLEGLVPYKTIVASFLPNPVVVPENLNPPFFLQLISPLARFNIKTASSLWFGISLISGIWGALLSLHLISPATYFKHHWLTYLFIYLAMYSTLMNTSYNQIGGILLFFVSVGYYFYLQQRDYWAGFLWGIIIAIKLFPALLFIFAFSQKRYTLIAVMLLTVLLACLWPLLARGPEIYALYFKMILNIPWQGGNWNASISGFLFRLFTLEYAHQHLFLIKIIYLCVSLVLLAWYIKKINFFRDRSEHHRAFCLTLTLMIMMSPMGWLYYFSLLLIPLTFLWLTLNQYPKISLLWIICIFLINAPLPYFSSNDMDPFIYRISLHSLYFYGVLLMVYLLVHFPDPPKDEVMGAQKETVYPVIISTSLALGLFTVLYNLITHWYKIIT
ncbi:glycosyltransferase family 87 protein [Legionella bononiensis]|uniref:DUF2029 domain-containing protein n=1 Tax=Legionella bononiensis TaxID=2793102 RepID=A0ABS1WBA0_9GAMM|nr:glycosyltransferase family 87 protein [Legionella bononiensis]MBL7481506.1 DUF2029 domain-containing protein [Legionella bononiensis]MBL7526626.1 DUF2029 domain-containing protein [Legionella bononiensis]